MIYGSVCSGIEAATVAWHGLGWKPAFFSEIEKFPRAVLQHHYPSVPLHGDFTTIERGLYEDIDLLVGGTPCQDFSVAGLRAGFSGARGGLTMEFARLAHRLKPTWLLWENVPCVLSIDRGRAFGAFLATLADCGYGFAYRVLDAQYFGVPQRRRRVFVVGYFGDWRPAAAVLFESESLRGDITPRRETGKASPTLPSRSTAGGGLGTDFDCDGGLIAYGGNNQSGPINVSTAVNAKGGSGRQDFETETLIAHTLTSNGDAHSGHRDEKGLVAIPIQDKATRYKGGGDLRKDDGSANGFGVGKDGDPYPTLGAHDVHAVAFAQNTRDELREMAVAGALAAQPGMKQQSFIRTDFCVRRLTPRECERLQGFPDDYTAITFNGKPAADGPRYKSLGNSMAVPVMRWIGERIDRVDAAINPLRQGFLA